MSREYTHLKIYEKEILELKRQGLTQREIASRFGVSYEKIHDFFKRHNKNQKKLASGMEIKPKGRPRKDGTALPPSVQQLCRASQLQYELSSKNRYIKRLEMENELLRDFLSLTERK